MHTDDASANVNAESAGSPVTFVVKFEGTAISPQHMPLRSMTAALSALQDLASWRDSFETSKVPPEKSISLVNVREGSACYDCVSQSPAEATTNFRRVGRFIVTPDADQEDDDLGTVLAPLKALSQVAKTCDCTVSVWTTGAAEEQLLTIDSGVYERVTERAFITGETTIIGELLRLGGATDVRCVMRIPGRRQLLYCDVEDNNLARRLGQHLYKQIVAKGNARWLNRTWRLVDFKVKEFSTPSLGDADDTIRELRNAGLSHWDSVVDPEALIRGTGE
jgi:hypothetical protein